MSKALGSGQSPFFMVIHVYIGLIKNLNGRVLISSEERLSWFRIMTCLRLTPLHLGVIYAFTCSFGAYLVMIWLLARPQGELLEEQPTYYCKFSNNFLYFEKLQNLKLKKNCKNSNSEDKIITLFAEHFLCCPSNILHCFSFSPQSWF